MEQVWLIIGIAAAVVIAAWIAFFVTLFWHRRARRVRAQSVSGPGRAVTELGKPEKHEETEEAGIHHQGGETEIPRRNLDMSTEDQAPSTPGEGEQQGAASTETPAEEVEVPAQQAAGAPSATAPEGLEAFLTSQSVADSRKRWDTLQSKFIDEPRRAVTDADTLVGEIVEQLSRTLNDHRRDLAQRWEGEDTSTEDLRGVLLSYRTFFDKLVTL